jgi:formamidopyrimidine-DNA glycosylase
VPELPEVETMRRLLAPAMEGARFVRVILNRPDLRIPFKDRFAERLRGVTVNAVTRRGKYLVVHLSSGYELVMHLGMSGWFYVAKTGDRTREPDRHDHVIFVMSSGKTIIYNDPRRFGLMDLAASDDYKPFGAMGPEPLSAEFDAAALARACRKKKISIKVALLNQAVVAGVGNIYASEALHQAKVSPRRRALNMAKTSGVATKEAERVVAGIKSVLLLAIKRAESPYRSGRFRVYDREGERCLRKGCGGVIARITQAARSTFYCPKCQK